MLILYLNVKKNLQHEKTYFGLHNISILFPMIFIANRILIDYTCSYYYSKYIFIYRLCIMTKVNWVLFAQIVSL